MSKLLGFTPVFDTENSLFLWYLFWFCLCTQENLPRIFHFFFRGYPNGWTIAYSKYLIMVMCIYIYTGTDSPFWEVFSLVYIYTLATVYIFTYTHVCIQVYLRNMSTDAMMRTGCFPLTWTTWNLNETDCNSPCFVAPQFTDERKEYPWSSPDPNNTWQIDCQKTCHTKMSDKNATMYVREKVGQNAR